MVCGILVVNYLVSHRRRHSLNGTDLQAWRIFQKFIEVTSRTHTHSYRINKHTIFRWSQQINRDKISKFLWFTCGVYDLDMYPYLGWLANNTDEPQNKTKQNKNSFVPCKYIECPCVIETESNHFQSTSFVFFSHHHQRHHLVYTIRWCNWKHTLFIIYRRTIFTVDTEYQNLIWNFITSNHVMSRGNKAGRRWRRKNTRAKEQWPQKV